MKCLPAALLLNLIFCLPQPVLADDDASISRGRYALQNGSFLLPAWGPGAWERAVKSTKPLPEAYRKTEQPPSQQAMTRFGLHPAPFENNGLPMGLRPAWSHDGRTRGLQIDCLLCHGGSIGGQSYVGLGNSTLDMVTFLNAMTRADGKRPPILTFNLNSERGTVNAGQLAIVLFSLRNADLSMRPVPLALGANLPEQDVPAWWNVAKKSTIYLDGRTPGESARSLMQFYLGELSEDQFAAYEPAFKDILAYIRSLKAPKYPFEIDQAQAAAGKVVFEKNCAKCHGTYGDNPEYPDTVVDLDTIGTDPARARGVSEKSIDHYNSTWFGQVHPVDKTVSLGYQAPPLDGIWATAPYLHNGSVPTVYHLLKSQSRPDKFLRQPSTSFEYYDKAKLGWHVQKVEGNEPPKFNDIFETRSLFDNTRYGLGNQGHTFGDRLTEDERMQVIEYLKQL